MEATSDCWRAFYYLLQASPPVMLVNARHARNPAGRSTPRARTTPAGPGRSPPSEHPIAQAIAPAANLTGPLLPVTGFESAPRQRRPWHRRRTPGGRRTGRVAAVQRHRAGGHPPHGTEVHTALKSRERGGATVIWVGVDGETAGIISLTDTVKAGWAAAIDRLKDLGLRPILLTGDSAAAAASVAAAVGIPAEDVLGGSCRKAKWKRSGSFRHPGLPWR
ncbi:HAD family hydrolase [uncultured Arthrobacter sp.]|uniref:HAD family hydrolase n=1 Tax=uncultured Arthrobacter sp. TaxID=114050 RepID=UPI003217DA61